MGFEIVASGLQNGSLVLGALGEDLGAIWAQDGPKAKKHQKSDFEDTPSGSKLGTQIGAGDIFSQKQNKKVGAGQASRKKQKSDDTRSGPMSVSHGTNHMF